MGDPGVLERVKIREVAGVFPSRAVAIPAIDDLLLAGCDRADIDVVAEHHNAHNRIGSIPIPAVQLADMPDARRQEFVAPEDIAAIIALCVAIMSCLGAMIGAVSAIAAGQTTTRSVTYVIVGAIVGCGLGFVIARYLGGRWRQPIATPSGTDGLIVWVHVRTPDREQKAHHILQLRGVDAVRVHEVEIEKRAENIPLSSLRPDPWLGDERLGTQ